MKKDNIDLSEFFQQEQISQSPTLHSDINKRFFFSLDDATGESQRQVIQEVNRNKANEEWCSNYYEDTKKDIVHIL